MARGGVQHRRTVSIHRAALTGAAFTHHRNIARGPLPVRSKLGPASGKETTMLNRVVLIGRLTRDPESSYTPNGIALAKFTVAVDRPTKNQETGEKETDFVPIVAWRRTAEFVTQYMTK